MFSECLEELGSNSVSWNITSILKLARLRALFQYSSSLVNPLGEKRSSFPQLGGLAGPQTPLLSRGASPPGPPSFISIDMRLVGHVTWKCILFSALKTQSLEVYTIFGPEDPKT